jgi:flagellar biogenesis protein FliO
MNLQEILVYIALIVAVTFLFKKFFFKKKKSNKNCGNDDCACH